jgi:hypothetical protein
MHGNVFTFSPTTFIELEEEMDTICWLPNRMNSVLLAFNLSLFKFIQLLISTKTASIFFYHALLFINAYAEWSSA